MAEEKKKKTEKPVRQSWKPHWTVSFLYTLWRVAFAVFKIALGAAATVAIICGLCALVFAGILGDYLQEDILPEAGIDIGDYSFDLNSYAYYVDSAGDIQLLQAIHPSDSNRDWVEYEDIPENLIKATIAIEDKRFFEHQGVDWVTTMKACFFMFFGNGDRGGSTITQQLIKNVTGENSYTVQRKVLEIFRATEFEKRYDKKLILELYLNWIYLGNRCDGVKTAAEKYFGKELENLTIAECASLISITNNPSLYNPYRENLDAGGMTGAERNRVRQLDTLEEMRDQELITEEEYQEAISQELVFKDGIAPEDKMANCLNETCGYRGTVSTLKHEEGSSLYTCPSCGSEVPVGTDASQVVYSWYMDTVYEDVARDLAERDGVEWNNDTKKQYKQLISKSGFHIFTCLDMEVQEKLDAIYTDLSQIPKTRSSQQLQSAMVIIDNTTGDVVALSGGVGEKTVHDQWNCATDNGLQTGSAIKPLSVYVPAFETGLITPATVVSDMPFSYDSGSAWPKNVDRKYTYSTTVRNAIEESINAAAVDTLDIIGTGYAFNFAKEKFGLSGLIENFVTNTGEVKSDVGYAPLALGALTDGVTVRAMADAFATFANDGVFRTGRTYTKVYDSNGNLILDNTQESREILSSKTVVYINDCLYDAANYGSGKDARISGQNTYGKTGSTSNNKDRWFCGYTGHYTAAVWCGYLQPEVMNLVGNGNPAAQLFGKVMNNVHKGLDRIHLVNENKLKEVTVCLDSGKIATEACHADPRTTEGFTRVDKACVFPEDVPTEVCDKHVFVAYCDECNAVANEYCKLFAEAEGRELSQKALVKLTQEQIDEIIAASKYKLDPVFNSNDYIYLINPDGSDGNFKGLNGKLNQGVDAPYIICTTHTKEAWEKYQESQIVVPEEPVQPEDPAQPEQDVNSGEGTLDSDAVG